MRILKRFRERNLGRKEKRDNEQYVFQSLSTTAVNFCSKPPAQLCDYRSIY